MRWTKAYIRRHRLGICLYLTFVGIFAVVLFLYRMPMEPVIYASSLCMVLGILILIVDGRRYHVKVKELEWQMEAVKNRTEKFPTPGDEIEETYQRLLENAQKERVYRVAELTKEKTEVTDYFTMWTHQIKTPIAAMHLLLQQEISSTEQYYERKKRWNPNCLRLNSMWRWCCSIFA